MVDILFLTNISLRKAMFSKVWCHDAILIHPAKDLVLNGVPLTFLYMMVKCLVGCMFWRNTCVEYNWFNIKTVDQHGWDESVIFYGTITRKHSHLAVSVVASIL